MKKSIIKILSLLLAATAVLLALSGCASTVQCEADSLIAAATEADEVSACVYAEGDDTLSLSGGAELADLIKGEWEKRSGVGDGEKVLSVTVSAQYEVCFFDDGTAMIYYGYCGVFEKDRQYFNVTLDTGLDSLVEYVKANGVVTLDDAETTSK